MTAVITGASKGIGFELAKQLGAVDDNVISFARSDGFKYLDLESVSSINALKKEFLNTPINLLVCNAGIYLDKDEDLKSGFNPNLWNKTFFVNVTSVFLLIQNLLPNIITGKGKIVIISSQMGSQNQANGGSYIYRASKAAVLNLGRNLAKDLKPEGVPVGIYHPGWVKTDMGGEDADISMTESARGLIQRFNDLSLENTGCFETWDGRSHPF
jgi:NAD(P)-dependent dehydrogenase (short-subunit alcohol dehydrogenase family)